MHDLIILFSGGADSALLVEMALMFKRKPLCLIVDYNQLHKQEIEIGKKFLEKRFVDYKIVKMPLDHISSGLTGNGEKGTYENVHDMYVPSRNLLFVSMASSIAETKKIKDIWMGANEEDSYNEFPDCKPEWVKALNNVLSINGSYPIKLSAPLSGASKEIIMATLKINFKVDMNELFSGYGNL